MSFHSRYHPPVIRFQLTATNLSPLLPFLLSFSLSLSLSLFLSLSVSIWRSMPLTHSLAAIHLVAKE